MTVSVSRDEVRLRDQVAAVVSSRDDEPPVLKFRVCDRILSKILFRIPQIVRLSCAIGPYGVH